MPYIIFVGPLPPPLGGVGVINASFQRLAYNGYEIFPFNTSNKRLREELYNGFPLHSIIPECKKIINLYRFIKNHKPSIINIFVTSGYSVIRDCLFIRTVSLFQIPILVHFHSKKYGEFALKQRRLKLLAGFFNKYADRIILLSEDHYNYFTNYFLPEKCVVIENFVEYEDFKCTVDEKTDEFLYVGRLTKEKGFFNLIDAVCELKKLDINLKINVIGLAATEIDQNLISARISKYQIENYFEFHGIKTGQAKFDIFKRSKVLLFPSHFENSPVVLKEAIAAKMGIIASDIEASKLILYNKGNAVWHQVNNPKSLANAIREYLSCKDLGMSLCLASSAIKDYDSSVAERKINQLISELV